MPKRLGFPETTPARRRFANSFPFCSLLAAGGHNVRRAWKDGNSIASAVDAGFPSFVHPD
jgi:hypothetical protein